MRAMMVSLGILRFPLTSIDSMTCPVWAAAKARNAKQEKKRPRTTATRTFNAYFKFPCLKDRNMPTSEHVSGNYDYTEATADAPLSLIATAMTSAIRFAHP